MDGCTRLTICQIFLLPRQFPGRHRVLGETNCRATLGLAVVTQDSSNRAPPPPLHASVKRARKTFLRQSQSYRSTHPHAKPHMTNNLRHRPPHLLPSTMYHGTH
jgi:hypothetical protein